MWPFKAAFFLFFEMSIFQSILTLDGLKIKILDFDYTKILSVFSLVIYIYMSFFMFYSCICVWVTYKR